MYSFAACRWANIRQRRRWWTALRDTEIRDEIPAGGAITVAVPCVGKASTALSLYGNGNVPVLPEALPVFLLDSDRPGYGIVGGPADAVQVPSEELLVGGVVA